MATEWVMVRVSRRTHSRLTAARDSLLRGYGNGLRELAFGDRDRVSLDQVISILLDEREDHSRRSRRSRTKSRAVAKPLQLPEPPQDGDARSTQDTSEECSPGS